MGVSGVGKTTLGKALSKHLKVPFFDGDDFHSIENVKKMEAGLPLNDDDRKNWLKTLAGKINEWGREEGSVLACSALKEKYRRVLSEHSDGEIVWIYLYEDYEVIQKRMNSRKGHYFKPELLRSQFDILEPPKYGYHIRVSSSAEKTLEKIMKTIHKQQIGLIGLGVMGKSLALNMASKSIPVSVYNREIKDIEIDIARDFAAKYQEEYEFPWFDDIKEFVKSLPAPRNIMIMIKAGKAVDAVIGELLPFLEKGDLIIDGGNSHYKDTWRRIEMLEEKGILFLGTGISGGEEGALKGPSIMPGGSKEAYERIGTVLEEIAAKDKSGDPCCTYIGKEGAGHFVKMVHNGVEYGEMQLIAEFYHFMRFSMELSLDDIAEVFEKWNTQLKSYLVEITSEILRKKEDSEYLIDKILDVAGQKGTGGWSTEAALELGVSLDTITAAVLARNLSANKEIRKRAQDIYVKSSKNSGNQISEAELYKAFSAARLINHAIGFELLREASKEYNWSLNLSEISRTWTNGCIIKSDLMQRLVDIYREMPDDHLLMHINISKELKETKTALSKTVGVALINEVPLQVASSALNYFMSFTSAQSSANMIQAQRDYFGAHTYERNDKPRGEFFHTIWKNTH